MLFSYKKYHAVKELELIRKNNLGSFYNYVNKKLNSRSDIPDICDEDGNLCTDNSAKCTVFNNFLPVSLAMMTAQHLHCPFE